MPPKATPDIRAIHAILKDQFERHPMPIVELMAVQTEDPFMVLCTTILSTRTKDQTTAAAARKLFTEVKTPADLERLSPAEIEKLIFPAGFYKVKAQSLHRLPGVLREKFNGRIPDTVEELCELPGVGRKVANLVVAVGFNKPAVCVDIHVHRISNRLGYVKTKDPFATEMALRKKLPHDLWITINTYLVSFGQHLCGPINPRCNACPIIAYCRRINVVTKYPPQN